MPRKKKKATQAESTGGLKLALSKIRKDFGDGAIMKFSDKPRSDVDAIPTGAISLDVALGIGGVPRGRIIEVYGPESSGKTTLCQHIIANAQKSGDTCAFIDVEHALDPVYARKIGVNVDAMLISQPDCGEDALNIAQTLVESGEVGIVVIDSVAALVPRAEIEGQMGDSHVGLQARLMSQALRKLTGIVKGTNTTLIFTNQIREKIGVMFGSPETTSGGRALKFYASVRMDIRGIETIKDKDGSFSGKRTRVKVIKNKVAPPFRQAEFDIVFGEGISAESSLLEACLDYGFIEKRGSWFTDIDCGEHIGQGARQVCETLRNSPELFAKLEKKVRDEAFKHEDDLSPQVFEPSDEEKKGQEEGDEDDNSF
jgi:recombination protein RecA